jgi:hypothetical protein
LDFGSPIGRYESHTMCKQRCRMLRNRFTDTYKGIVEGLEEVWSFKSVCHTGCDCSPLRVRNILQTSDNADDLENCYSMLNQMDPFAKMWLPCGPMSTLDEYKNICNDNATLLGNNLGKRCVWASIASSYNDVSPAHVCYSCVSRLRIKKTSLSTGNGSCIVFLFAKIRSMYCALSR